MSLRFRLCPTADQRAVMEQHCRDARYVWNLALEQMNLWSPGRSRVDMSGWDRQLAEARQTFGWLARGSSSVQQAALRDLRQAFRNWWSRPDHFGRPTWRKAGFNEGFVVRDLTVTQINRRWATITVPKAGAVRFRLTRPSELLDGCRSARVRCDRAGRWHVSLVAAQPPVERQSTGCSVGIDVGITHTVTTSDGEHLDMAVLLSPGEQQRLRRLQRRLGRQHKGSNRRERTKRAIARLRAREADRRRDWIEQTTTRLVRAHDLVAIEDLRVKQMLRSASGTADEPGCNVAAKRGLNRQISTRSWSTFRRRLEQKAAAATSPVEVVAVNPVHTSQRCAVCGHTAPGNRESQAVFRCAACGHQANADVNAAVNILAAGLAVTGRGGTPHAQAQRPREASTPGKELAA
jgi:putative transposase